MTNPSSAVAADPANSAAQRSAAVWKETTQVIADQANAMMTLRPDLGGALSRFVEYVQDGVEVNREFSHRWGTAMLDMAEVGKAQFGAGAGFAAGHGKSISTWVFDEIALLSGSRRG